MMSDKRYRLHPVSAIINFVKGLKELIIPFLIIVVANGFDFSFNPREENFWSNIVPLLIFSLISLIYLFSGIFKWWTFVYWFEDNELRVKYGLFIKKKRFIPFDRIQSLNHKEGIFHRIFGLVQVMVETAGSTDGKPEVILTAITKEAANALELETRKVKQTIILDDKKSIDEQNEKSHFNLIHKMSAKDLVILATTSNSIGVVLAGVVAVLTQLSDLIPYEWIFEEVSAFIKYGFVVVAITVIIAFLLAWLSSILITFINYYDFTVIEEEQRLIVTRGLLEKKRITIPLNRIQAIKFVENPFRQMFGYTAVVIESASGGLEKNEKQITLFPLISKRQVYKPLQQLLPQFEWEVALTRPPKRAKSFFYRADFIWLLPIVIVCSYFFYPLGLLSILLTVPVLLMRFWQYKTAGFAICGHQLTIVYRVISRITFIVEKNRIQAMDSKQSLFQKRKNVASVQVTVMSGMTGASAKAANLDQGDTERVLHWFDRSAQE